MQNDHKIINILRRLSQRPSSASFLLRVANFIPRLLTQGGSFFLSFSFSSLSIHPMMMMITIRGPFHKTVARGRCAGRWLIKMLLYCGCKIFKFPDACLGNLHKQFKLGADLNIITEASLVAEEEEEEEEVE